MSAGRWAIFSVALGLGAASLGCSSTFSLTPTRASTRSAARDCSIGVGPVRDSIGVDYGFTLQDHLRELGPCRRVERVTDPNSHEVDLVISGEVEKDLKRAATVPTAVQIAGAFGVLAMAFGGGAWAFGEWGLKNTPGPTRDGFRTGGQIGIIAGAGVMVTWIAIEILDGVIGKVRGEGTVDASFTVVRKGRRVTDWKVHDEVDVYIDNEDPYDRASAPAFAVGDEALEKVLMDAAGRVTGVVDGQ